MNVETDILDSIRELRGEFNALKVEHAASKPVEQIVKFLLYFWLTLSVVLGFFGWAQLSDIDTKIDSSVLRHFPEDSKEYLEYKQLIAKTRTLKQKFEALTETYKERVDDLKYADVIASNFDIAGQVGSAIC